MTLESKVMIDEVLLSGVLGGIPLTSGKTFIGFAYLAITREDLCGFRVGDLQDSSTDKKEG